MSLNDFLADESTGKTSWADEMDDFPLAPAPKDYGRRGGDYLSTVPDRADRDRGFERPERSYPPREELPLPTKPPFTAFIGNLAFDLTEPEVEDFFAPAKTVSVRIVQGHDGRPKGFGYVEFETLDGLKLALERSGSQLASRTVRVSVAEPPKSSGPSFSSAADETSQWRRSGPLPPAADAPPRGAGGPRPERSGFLRSESGASGFDNMDVSGGSRSGFGSKFAPSAAREAPPHGSRPPREPAAVEPSVGDTASDWRTGKPVESVAAPPPSARRPSAGPAGGAEGKGDKAPFFRKSDATDVDEKFASQERMGFGSKFSPAPTPPESPSNAKRTGFGFGAAERRGSGATPGGAPAAAVAPSSVSDTVDNWRGARKAPSGGPAGGSPKAPAAAPAERKKLELKPRGTAPAAAAASPSTSRGSNPFGNAKPVDASEREREIEEKLAQREKERKEEERIKREKIKAEKEKASAAKGGKGPTRTSAAASENGKEDGGAASTEGSTVTEEKATPVKPKPAPVGAWGKGRKPSGALVGGESGAIATTNGNVEQKEDGDKEVDEVAKDVEKVEIKA
ncbi:hypothetical protein IE53DRAFT_364292 [Violaceomyces palustris]|uniref:Uncharacterized protein n=1 Tax=Violaceomyces palustris TaxID=1673888 RepID=A0ACD0NQ69_9BASI|nr:hypothetical protein IE53DRAFT_364292 [Violaceomyces palustris]